MPQYHFPGEPLTKTYPADVEEVVFDGVTVSRIVGSEDQVRATTSLMSAMFPKSEFAMDTLNDAKFLGHAVSEIEGRKYFYQIYELIVMRKKHAG